MTDLSKIYKSNLSLLTDLYQITMAYGYWKNNKHEQEAVYELYFRKNPFGGGFSISAGLATVIDYLENWTFEAAEIKYLASLKNPSGSPMFEKGFLDYLEQMKFSCSVEGIPEGEIIFPFEPVLKVRGPLLQAQLIETPLLTLINFQTLIATKAARLKLATDGDTILEFGLRRAQGIDGGLSATRAAFVGGVDATSNVQAGMLFGIPVKGTHAHSWILSFDEEVEAFEAFAKAMPENTILLVDTYDTLEGVASAIETMKKLRSKNILFHGIRLDSGDLAYLSIEARKMLDQAGFTATKIVASNDLDEYIIQSLKNSQNAKIDIWGVGTKLVTAYDQPALGGVYKLTNIKNQDGKWESKIKLSEQAIKVTTPGDHQIVRFYKNGKMRGDMVFDVHLGQDAEYFVDPTDVTRRKKIKIDWDEKLLLEPIFEKGKKVYQSPSLVEIRENTLQNMMTLDDSVKRFTHPHHYTVGLEPKLDEKKRQMIHTLRKH